MTTNPYSDAPDLWPDLAPLGSKLWVLTVKLMDEYVDAWDRLVEDDPEAVLAELGRMREGKRCRNRAVRDALQGLEREFFLIGPGAIDPHDPEDVGMGLDPAEDEPTDTFAAERRWAGWIATFDHQSSLADLTEWLTPEPLENLVHNQAGVQLDGSELRFVRILVDLRASEAALKGLVALARSKHREVSDVTRGIEERRYANPSRVIGWEYTLRIELERRRAETEQTGEAAWRIYRRMQDSTVSEQTAKKYMQRVKDDVASRLRLETTRLKKLKAIVRAAETEIEDPDPNRVRFLHDDWVVNSLSAGTRRKYRYS